MSSSAGSCVCVVKLCQLKFILNLISCGSVILWDAVRVIYIVWVPAEAQVRENLWSWAVLITFCTTVIYQVLTTAYISLPWHKQNENPEIEIRPHFRSFSLDIVNLTVPDYACERVVPLELIYYCSIDSNIIRQFQQACGSLPAYDFTSKLQTILFRKPLYISVGYHGFYTQIPKH